MSHRQIVPEPSAAVLTTFEMPIPPGLAHKRILTRNQLANAVAESRELDALRYVRFHANATQVPTVAAKLYAAHTRLGARPQLSTLSEVLGENATPFELALIIWGGTRDVELYDFFAKCMVQLLAEFPAPRNQFVARLQDECMPTLCSLREGDPDIARVIFSDATLRKRFGCFWASRGLTPDELP